MTDPERFRLSPGDGVPNENANAGRMLQVLWRGKWILLVVPALAFAAAHWWLERQVPLYQATAQVLVGSREVNPLKSGQGDALNKPRTVLKQQQQLLRSSAILRPLSEDAELLAMRTFAPERLGDKPVVSELFDSLTTAIDVESDRLIINFLGPVPAEAGRVVEKAIDLYLAYHRNKKREEAQLSYDIVQHEWERSKAELAETTAKIAQVRSEHRLAAGMEKTVVEGRLEEAYAAWNAAHLLKIKEQSTYEGLLLVQEDTEEFKKRGEYWRQTKPIPTLESQIEYAVAERQEREKRYEKNRLLLDEANPNLAKLRAEIEEFRAREDEIILQYARDFMRNAERSYQDAERQEKLLEADVDSLEEQIFVTNRVLEELADYEKEREGLRGILESFEERMTELQVEDQVGALNLDVLEVGRVSQLPVSPDVEGTRLYSIAGGLLLAFVSVVLRGFADRRIRDPEEIPALLHTGVLGVLPALSGDDERSRIGRLVEEEPESLAAEAIRNVRTATTFALPEDGKGIVLVTSAVSGEGKSITASNLAFSLAHAGRRTLLVDGDMRKPAQDEIYGLEKRPGLGNLLSSSKFVLRKTIVKNVALGLDLLPAGDAPGKWAELCESPAFIELLHALREQYEVVVVDAPPVLETSESRVMAAHADAVVFVMRLDVSSTTGAQRAVGILRGVGAKLVGIILNGARSQRGARAYAGGISHGDAQVRGPRRARSEGAEGEREGVAAPGSADFLGVEERA